MEKKHNQDEILENRNDLKRLVPGLLLDHTGIEKEPCCREQELFYRATNYRGS